MKLKLIIVADHNDADYMTEIVDITSQRLKRLQPVIDAIRAFKPYKTGGNSGLEWEHTHNWPRGEYSYRPDLGEKTPEELYGNKCSRKALQEFDEMVPTSEGNVHTIESMTLLKIKEITELL